MATALPPHRPRHIRRDLLVLAIAWKLQEKVYGGLTAAQKRRLAGITEESSRRVGTCPQALRFA